MKLASLFYSFFLENLFLLNYHFQVNKLIRVLFAFRMLLLVGFHNTVLPILTTYFFMVTRKPEYLFLTLYHRLLWQQSDYQLPCQSHRFDFGKFQCCKRYKSIMIFNSLKSIKIMLFFYNLSWLFKFMALTVMVELVKNILHCSVLFLLFLSLSASSCSNIITIDRYQEFQN